MRTRLTRMSVAVGIALAGLAVGAFTATAQTVEDQIAQAVMPAPENMRAGAKVLGYKDGKLQTLRQGDGSMICLADDPNREGFHVACYHRSLEPFMARGRELRAGGMNRRDALAKRWEEMDSGTLEMPKHPAALYTLSSRDDKGGLDDSDNLFRLTVIYTPYATVAEVGLPTDPKEGLPWLMFPGKPSAHVMIH